MPYRTIKRVKPIYKGTLLVNVSYAGNFQIDLDDEKTWRLYPLGRLPPPVLRGRVLRLLDHSGNEIGEINEEYEFQTYCSQHYLISSEITEERYMRLPQDLVLAYAIEEGMMIELLLSEISRDGKWEKIFPKTEKIGPIDVVPLTSSGKPSKADLASAGPESGSEEIVKSDKRYDIFICHASEDKETFVKGLAEALSREGLKVWYDDFTLQLGDSLRRSIDHGLSCSRYGAVVLSESFFQKDWPQKELDGLVAKEHNFDKVILPIWHRVTREQVQSFSPLLADRLAVSSSKGLDIVVRQILEVVRTREHL